jgi:very-short-patch-repair endonuclease
MRDDRKLSSPRAKNMRQTMTNAEVILWSRLRRKQVHGVAFRRQHPIGPFIADFACWEARLVIEVDGPSHISDEAQANDAHRTDFLNQQGWQVLRVWNNDIYGNLHGVMDAISIRVWENLQAIETALNFSSPAQRGRCHKGGMGVFSSESAMPEANTPSALRAPPPLGGGGKDDL